MRFLADENFNNRILRGVLRENPDIDLIRVQDTEVWRAGDPSILAWAAREGRIVLTHDVRTMTQYANDRIRAGLPMPGAFAISRQVPIGRAVAELLIVAGASDADEWANQVNYLPQRLSFFEHNTALTMSRVGRSLRHGVFHAMNRRSAAHDLLPQVSEFGRL